MSPQIERLFGGSPLAVLAKLVFMSLVVGAIMVGLGVTPMSIFARAVAALRSVMHLGVDAFRDIGRTILTGAIVVIPIWLVMRLMKRG